MFDETAGNPAYTHEVLEEVWMTEIDFLSQYSEMVFEYTLVEDILLFRTDDYLYAYSAKSGEALWAFEGQNFFIPVMDEVIVFNDQIYMLGTVNRGPSLIGFDKNTGELLATLSLHDLGDIEGEIFSRSFHQNKVYFAVQNPNQNYHVADDFSLFIYEYDLSTQSLKLLHKDPKVYRLSHGPGNRPAVNEDNTSIFFRYLKKEDDQYLMEIVEIPFDGTSPSVVVKDVLNINRIDVQLLHHRIVIKGDHLIIGFRHRPEKKLRAYEISTGELIWKRVDEMAPILYMDNLYAINFQSSGPLELIDSYTGQTLWSQNIRGTNHNLSILDHKPLAGLRAQNNQSMSILDLDTGSTLVSVSLEDLGFGTHQNHFLNNSFSYDQGEKIILATSGGQIFCLRHPL